MTTSTPPSSPIPRKRSNRGELTRGRILDAATALFAERGFAPVTMRAIGEASGIDNSSVYRHFESKNALARSVLDRAMESLVAAVAPHQSAPATLAGVVDAVTAAAMHLWDQPATARLVLQWVTSAQDAATGFDVSLPVEAPGAPSGGLFRGMREVIQRAERAGTVRPLVWPDILVAIVGVVALRPATFRSFVASQEGGRTDDRARADWEREVGDLLRGMLAP